MVNQPLEYALAEEGACAGCDKGRLQYGRPSFSINKLLQWCYQGMHRPHAR